MEYAPGTDGAEFAQRFLTLGMLFIAGAGITLLFQAKRSAVQLFVLGVGSIAISLAGPGVEHRGMGLLLVVFVVLFALSLLGHVFSFFLGRSASDVAIGTLVGNFITGVLVLLVLPIKFAKRWLWWKE